uniref:Reverse transcriptase zinc-binding domain-containing protein n=1 Tax=Chenopodium quinoa TaxID=63459 RepID=A0A803MZ92_CHEQI
MIMDLFLPFEQERILSIPLSERRPADCLYWDASCSNDAAVRKAWNLMWSEPVLPRVKVFFWRACHEAVPTKKGLHIRIKDIDEVCGVCGEEKEDVSHALLCCPQAISIWEECGFAWEVEGKGRSLMDWVFQKLCCLVSEHRSWVMVLCWSIWSAWNRGLFENDWYEPRGIASYVHQLMSDMGNSFVKKKGDAAPKQRGCWCLPAAGRIKVNIDAGLLCDLGIVVGVVARTDEGSVLWCANIKLADRLEPKLAEAKAILMGMKLAAQVEFENDCENVVNAIRRKDKGNNSAIRFSFCAWDLLPLPAGLRGATHSLPTSAFNIVVINPSKPETILLICYIPDVLAHSSYIPLDTVLNAKTTLLLQEMGGSVEYSFPIPNKIPAEFQELIRRNNGVNQARQHLKEQEHKNDNTAKESMAEIEKMMGHGCDLNETEECGRTELRHIAASDGSEKCVYLLLDYGADPDCKDQDGNIPLWNAMQGGHEAVVKLLIIHGAYICAGDVGQYGCIATVQNNLDLLKKIVSYGGDVTFPLVTSTAFLKGAHCLARHQWTPRALAEQQCHEQISALFQAKVGSKPQVVFQVPDELRNKVHFLGRYTSAPNLTQEHHNLSKDGSASVGSGMLITSVTQYLGSCQLLKADRVICFLP